MSIYNGAHTFLSLHPLTSKIVIHGNSNLALQFTYSVKEGIKTLPFTVRYARTTIDITQMHKTPESRIRLDLLAPITPDTDTQGRPYMIVLDTDPQTYTYTVLVRDPSYPPYGHAEPPLIYMSIYDIENNKD